MADVKINFVHPTGGQVLTVTLDDTFTATEIVSELIASEFIPQSREGYQLVVAGADQLRDNQTLRDAGVADGSKIRVIPATDAGTHAPLNDPRPPSLHRLSKAHRS